MNEIFEFTRSDRMFLEKNVQLYFFFLCKAYYILINSHVYIYIYIYIYIFVCVCVCDWAAVLNLNRFD